MKRFAGTVLLTALSCVVSLVAADSVSGSWTITGDIMGNPINSVCTIKQENTTLTGSCDDGTASHDLTGTVEGQKVTFTHGGEYQGTALTVTYTGTLDEQGVLKGAVDVQPYNANGTFTATREKDKKDKAGK